MAAKLFALLLPTCAVARDVVIDVDASRSLGPWHPINRFFGADEPNFATYPQGANLLQELGSISKNQTYFRTHNLLTTGSASDDAPVGVPKLKWGSTDAYTEDQDGNPIYNWTVIDAIFDSYLERNVKPYVQMGFMPLALAEDRDPYFFTFNAAGEYNVIYTGWTHPPTSFTKWGELIYRWATHAVERYGEEEVNSWWWETWNEPNIAYWNGTKEQYFELNDVALDAVRRAAPRARIGGPDLAGGTGGDWLHDFLTHCSTGKNYASDEPGTPIDFVSFHAKGAPLWINDTTEPDHVQMNVSTQLRQIDEAFGVVASFEQFKDKPIVIGEMDPDGCAACTTPAYGYRNDLMYPAYTAASFIRTMDLSARRGVNLQGALTWAFEFEPTELLTNQTRFFEGFRVLATQGVDKPVLNLHRMLGMMSGERVQANSTGQYSLDRVLRESIRGDDTDVGSVAAFDAQEHALYVFVWNYHDNDLNFTDATVALSIEGLPDSFTQEGYGGMVQAKHYRIDESHSNSYTTWLRMGSPQTPSVQQYTELQRSGQLQFLGPPEPVEIKNGGASFNFTLPVRAMSLLVVGGPSASRGQ